MHKDECHDAEIGPNKNVRFTARSLGHSWLAPQQEAEAVTLVGARTKTHLMRNAAEHSERMGNPCGPMHSTSHATLHQHLMFQSGPMNQQQHGTMEALLPATPTYSPTTTPLATVEQ